MKSIYSIVPEPEVILALEPEEVAGVVLEHLNSINIPHEVGALNRHNFSLVGTVKEYPEQYRHQILEVLMEGWVWLEREGLIAPRPGQDRDWIFITRRGKQIKSRAKYRAYQDADILPRKFIHPSIIQKIWSSFIRGEYDTAVFQAFKEVEVSVRAAGGYSDTDYGTTLMRKAFEETKGPLTNMAHPLSERQALGHLFAGAIGSYKNPQSHKNVSITDPIEAAEMIILASHLLKIVDSRIENAPCPS